MSDINEVVKNIFQGNLSRYEEIIPMVKSYVLKICSQKGIDFTLYDDWEQSSHAAIISIIQKGHLQNITYVKSYIYSVLNNLIKPDNTPTVINSDYVDKLLSHTLEKFKMFHNESELSQVQTIQLQNCIELLRERDRMIIIGHFWTDLNYNKIAESLNISGARVNELKNRALLKIRNCLEA